MAIFKRTPAVPTVPTVYQGLAGLESAVPAELAARVFLGAFAGAESRHVRPETVLGILQRLSGVDEVPGMTVRGTLTTPRARYALDPVFVQCVLLWERALIAGRLSRGSEAYHHLVLLPMGARALVGADPEAAVRTLLDLSAS
ncbi:hypothetical protein ASD23_15610 [Agromyces sp. Root1464]|uniref:hypothetical protein n=1 Tax=Agromyces sp. Root1464 TaxID=1736467 RepID=UPI0006FE8227|nr:hypothetical protein [Agromyces sp. Root1464]KQZ09620.1 hypothetical protein ASD23_15610 [Agromyces sp. Root1464]